MNLEVRPAYAATIGSPESTRADNRASRELTTLRTRTQELEAYARTVAHDLKDPLAIIIATSDAIFHISDLTPEELSAYLQQIRSTAHAMNNMIDNLLLLSELDASQAPLSPINMEEIVSHVQARLSYMVQEHHARVTACTSWPAAIGYAPWVEEVWANLISNAIKYGGRPPVVELGAASRRDGMAVFWVRDNGEGLKPEAEAQIFKARTQLGPARRTGHGLGLWITRRIVERLGGQAGVRTQEGRGSVFFFTLPAAK